MLGSIRMKKIAFVLVAAGLMSLAACHKPAETATNNEADMATMDNSADNVDTMAANSTEATANVAMDNATVVDNAVVTNK
jgi:hypothetical protein